MKNVLAIALAYIFLASLTAIFWYGYIPILSACSYAVFLTLLSLLGLYPLGQLEILKSRLSSTYQEQQYKVFAGVVLIVGIIGNLILGSVGGPEMAR